MITITDRQKTEQQTLVIHRGNDQFIKTKGECNIHMANPIIINNKDFEVSIDAGKIFHSSGFLGLEKSKKEQQKDELDFILTDFGLSYKKRKFLCWLFSWL